MLTVVPCIEKLVILYMEDFQGLVTTSNSFYNVEKLTADILFTSLLIIIGMHTLGL